ncbi:terminase small subunit [Tenacibaculum sp. C7A-26P2]|uniref:terminase small subunit n=1 Tax=Tenacibaculum sp. C7A-26P2 TaxID=3447504 RepID=UPI003F87B2BE
MGASKGNQHWKIRGKDGRDKKYTPETLLRGANRYFNWCQNNPLKEEQIVNKAWTEYIEVEIKDEEGNPKKVEKKITHPYSIAHLSKMRPFTIHGLCNFLEICVKTFDNYSKDKDFLQVTTRIRQIIYNQKFEGAASGFLNPNIIARDLGLADKKSVELEGSVNIPIEQWISNNNKTDVNSNSETE